MSIIELETNRGGRSIICDHYRYRYDRQCVGGELTWRCALKHCTVRIRTDAALAGVLHYKNKHNHELDRRKTERQILRVRLKRKAIEDTNGSPKKMVCSALNMVDKEFLQPGDLQSVTRAMYRERQKHVAKTLHAASTPVVLPVPRSLNTSSSAAKVARRKKSVKNRKTSQACRTVIKMEQEEPDNSAHSQGETCLREEAAAKISGTSGADSAQGKTLSLGQKNVDIMQLLSGAQQRYESKTKGGSELMQSISVLSSVSAGVPPLIKPTPVKLPGDTSGSGGDGPSQLQALFQNVKLTQQLQQRPGGMVDQFTGDPPPDVTINPLHRSLSVTEVESGASPRNLATAGSLTVEEIERQQREQIKRSDSRGQGQLQEGGMSQSPAARELLSILTAAAGDGQGSSLPAMPQMPLTTTGDARVKQEPPESVTARSTELLTPGDFAPAVKRLDSTTGGLGGPCPDVLMTPLAFAAPQQPPLLTASPSTPISSAALLEQLGNLQRGSQGSPGLASPPPPDVSPLTRQQLQQAMIHVIRTDEDFVSRLHEAYLASFRQQLGSFPSAKR